SHVSSSAGNGSGLLYCLRIRTSLFIAQTTTPTARNVSNMRQRTEGRVFSRRPSITLGLRSEMPASSEDTLLQIDSLSVSFRLARGDMPVVRNLSLSIQRGEIAGLLGESGCGKTTTALAILGLQPSDAIVHGRVRFQNNELAGASEQKLDAVRGAQISLVLQEPLLSLNPVLRVIDQVEQVLKAHHLP